MLRMRDLSWLLLTLTLLFLFPMSCKKKAVQPRFQGFVIGDDDIVASNGNGDQERFSSAIAATGAIVSHDDSLKSHYCTGALIAPSDGSVNPRVITNAHCFTEEANPMNGLTNWACTKTKIYLGLTNTDPEKYTLGSCNPGTLRIDGEADIAVFELSEPTPAALTWFRLAIESPNVGTNAFVVHHPVVSESMVVPGGGSVKVPPSMLTKDNCTITAKEELGRGSTDQFSYDIGHTCDIIGGSSGAPIIDVESGEIIALNWGGIEWSGSQTLTQENRGIAAGYLGAFVEDRVESYKASVTPPSVLREKAEADSSQVKTSPLDRGKQMIQAAGCATKMD